MQTKVKNRTVDFFDLEQQEINAPAVSETGTKEGKQGERLQYLADQLVEELLSKSSDEIRSDQVFAQGVSNLGADIQKQLVHRSNLLQEPMKVLMTDLKDGGSVAKDLLDLQHQINQIDPNRFNFKMSGFRRLLSKLPGVGTVLSNWLVRFESVQSVINDIVDSLKVGRGRLERDNITLSTDRDAMHELSNKLGMYVDYGKVLDVTLTERVDGINDPDRKDFLSQEVLFPLRQRILDLQQQQAVNQHGMVTSEAIIRNNKELIRGVDRSLNVTVVAFQTASALSVALEHQKTVLKGVDAINKTTDDLLLSTSKKLKEQGADIQKRASQASIDIAVVEQSFKNVQSALEQVQSFRLDALPKMSASIQKMEKVNLEMGGVIDKLEQSKTLSEKVKL